VLQNRKLSGLHLRPLKANERELVLRLIRRPAGPRQLDGTDTLLKDEEIVKERKEALLMDSHIEENDNEDDIVVLSVNLLFVAYTFLPEDSSLPLNKLSSACYEKAPTTACSMKIAFPSLPNIIIALSWRTFRIRDNPEIIVR